MASNIDELAAYVRVPEHTHSEVMEAIEAYANDRVVGELERLSPQPTSLGAYFPTNYIKKRIAELTKKSLRVED